MMEIGKIKSQATEMTEVIAKTIKSEHSEIYNDPTLSTISEIMDRMRDYSVSWEKKRAEISKALSLSGEQGASRKISVFIKRTNEAVKKEISVFDDLVACADDKNKMSDCWNMLKKTMKDLDSNLERIQPHAETINPNKQDRNIRGYDYNRPYTHARTRRTFNKAGMEALRMIGWEPSRKELTFVEQLRRTALKNKAPNETMIEYVTNYLKNNVFNEQEQTLRKTQDFAEIQKNTQQENIRKQFDTPGQHLRQTQAQTLKPVMGLKQA